MRKEPGILYVVATPIGNLKDISARAVEILKLVNFIAAEDTRHSASLLQYLEIKTPLISLHEFNERQRVDKLIVQLRLGESIALISDAGTPLISDPGFVLVREAHLQGVKIVPIPGACAAIAALSAAGLPTDKFIFEGFLPAKMQARRAQLTQLKDESRTLIFYEAPHRILELLEDIQVVLGEERRLVIARELTKLYETIKSGYPQELIDWMKADANQQRGEFVVLVEGVENIIPPLESEKLLSLLIEELPVKKAVEIVAKLTQEKRNELYDKALSIKNQKAK